MPLVAEAKGQPKDAQKPSMSKDEESEQPDAKAGSSEDSGGGPEMAGLLRMLKFMANTAMTNTVEDGPVVHIADIAAMALVPDPKELDNNMRKLGDVMEWKCLRSGRVLGRARIPSCGSWMQPHHRPHGCAPSVALS